MSLRIGVCGAWHTTPPSPDVLLSLGRTDNSLLRRLTLGVFVPLLILFCVSIHGWLWRSPAVLSAVTNILCPILLGLFGFGIYLLAGTRFWCTRRPHSCSHRPYVVMSAPKARTRMSVALFAACTPPVCALGARRAWPAAHPLLSAAAAGTGASLCLVVAR